MSGLFSERRKGAEESNDRTSLHWISLLGGKMEYFVLFNEYSYRSRPRDHYMIRANQASMPERHGQQIKQASASSAYLGERVHEHGAERPGGGPNVYSDSLVLKHLPLGRPGLIMRCCLPHARLSVGCFGFVEGCS